MLQRKGICGCHCRSMQRRGTVRKGVPSNSKRNGRRPCKGHCYCRVSKQQTKSLSKGRRTAKLDQCPVNELRAATLKSYLNSHSYDLYDDLCFEIGI